ncbi:MAG TPA: cellulase family glycosylhydrolase [Bradyrhizobium sp.]|nr:cellulase family glycosylhydrolase [Bradyrhizobium sp.]
MKRLTLALLCSATILLPDAADACAVLQHTVPAERIHGLARGFNADGWINGEQSAPPPALLAQLRKSGMTHVRLPVPAEQIMERFAATAERKARLDAVDAALATLVSFGYYVSIDLHAGEAFNQLHRETPADAMPAMKGAWRDLAQIMRRHPANRVFAELLNEPDLEAERWQSEVEELALFVRELLPRTTLIVGPVNWQRPDSLPGFRPLSDFNVVYAIHFYDPMVFTHQAHWDPKEPLHDISGLPYPIRADDPDVQKIRRQLTDANNAKALAMLDKAIPDERIDKWLEPAAQWQQQFSRPIIINEFGVLKAGAPRESRLRWLSSVVSYAEDHCWGWTHWELSQGFGLLDGRSGQIDRSALKALLDPASPPAVRDRARQKQAR